MTITQWHVPIDDERHYWYAIFTSFGAPVDKDGCGAAPRAFYELPGDYIPRKNKSNDYGFDPRAGARRPSLAWARTSTCTISGPASRWRDPGPQQGASRTIRQGDQRLSAHSAWRHRGGSRQRRPAADGARSGCRRGHHRPAAIDGIGPSDDWQTYWRKTD